MHPFHVNNTWEKKQAPLEFPFVCVGGWQCVADGGSDSGSGLPGMHDGVPGTKSNWWSGRGRFPSVDSTKGYRPVLPHTFGYYSEGQPSACFCFVLFFILPKLNSYC